MSGEVGQYESTSAPGPFGRWLEWACKVAAIAGALVFVSLVVMSIVSISMRKAKV